MAWRRVEVNGEQPFNEIWVLFGKEPRGKGDVNVKVIEEGEYIEGYIEKIKKSIRFKQSVVSLIKDDIRYLMFAPKDLEKKIDKLIEEVDGKMVYTRITFLGLKELGNDRKAYIFEVEYDDERIFDE